MGWLGDTDLLEVSDEEVEDLGVQNAIQNSLASQEGLVAVRFTGTADLGAWPHIAIDEIFYFRASQSCACIWTLTNLPPPQCSRRSSVKVTPACEFGNELLNFAMNFRTSQRSSKYYSEKLAEIDCT